MKVPLMYLCMYKRLEGKYKNNEITRKEFSWLLGKVFPVEKKLRNPIIKELQNFKLIKSVSLDKFTIIKNKINLNNTSKIYRSVGLN